MLKKIVNEAQREKLASFLPKIDVTLDVTPIEESLIRKNVQIDRNIIEQACAALNAGLHIIFTGPPGTGKTTIAEAIVQEAFKKSFSQGKGLFTTATADWTTFDTIGGYLPVPSSGAGLNYSLEFFKGQFLEAISKNEWLIIDELNRADIDKAIGPLFTVLSKKGVQLPYFIDQERIKIEFGKSPSSSDSVFTVLPTWRVIATMNSYDKMSLYRISSAFLRRFAVIYVGLPPKYREYITQRVRHLTSDVRRSFVNLIIKLCAFREIGPSIVNDMIKYIEKRADQKNGFCEAINLFLIPQIEGSDFSELEESFKIMDNEISFIEVDIRKSVKLQRLIFLMSGEAAQVTEQAGETEPEIAVLDNSQTDSQEEDIEFAEIATDSGDLVDD